MYVTVYTRTSCAQCICMYVRMYVVYVRKPVKVSCLHNVGKGLQSELHINNAAAHLKHVYMRTYVCTVHTEHMYLCMYVHTYIRMYQYSGKQFNMGFAHLAQTHTVGTCLYSLHD